MKTILFQIKNRTYFNRFQYIFRKNKYSISQSKSLMNLSKRNLFNISSLIVDKSTSTNYINNTVEIYCRVQNIVNKGKIHFLTLRQDSITMQGVIEDHNLFGNVEKLNCEAFIFVKGVIQNAKIKKFSIKNFEILIKEIIIISNSDNKLPIQIEDLIKNPYYGNENSNNKTQPKINNIGSNINVSTRLDNRVLDLRIPYTQALMKSKSKVTEYFRNYLLNEDFIEIHTPKILNGSSEGGSEVFTLNYFNKEASLAQSPQLFKQMCVIGGLEKVFEIAPVYRAEKSTGNRHMTEFIMMDIEISLCKINKNIYPYSYFHSEQEKLFGLISYIHSIFKYIFDNLSKDNEINAILLNGNEFIHYSDTPLMISFKDAIDLLNENSKEIKLSYYDDFSESSEKRLGEIIFKKYKKEFYFVYNYPTNCRAFYTKKSSSDNNFSLSFDAFIRGEEILSGALRENNYEELINNLKNKGMNEKNINFYLESFKYGVPEHGGVGIGLDRIIKLIYNLNSVKLCSIFPRDPYRLSP